MEQAVRRGRVICFLGKIRKEEAGSAFCRLSTLLFKGKPSNIRQHKQLVLLSPAVMDSPVGVFPTAAKEEEHDHLVSGGVERTEQRAHMNTRTKLLLRAAIGKQRQERSVLLQTETASAPCSTPQKPTTIYSAAPRVVRTRRRGWMHRRGDPKDKRQSSRVAGVLCQARTQLWRQRHGHQPARRRGSEISRESCACGRLPRLSPSSLRWVYRVVPLRNSPDGETSRLGR